MKNLFQSIALLFLILTSYKSQGQFIQSLTISPSNPTTADTITILAECAFPSGGCEEHTQGSFVNGSIISGFAIHCLGPLTVICYYTDTFQIAPLAAGNYSFIFQLDAGFGPSPCTPGIVPGPTDTLNFTVTLSSGQNNELLDKSFSVYPNPVNDLIYLTQSDSKSQHHTIEILSVDGKTVLTKPISNLSEPISVKELQNGFYFIKLKTLYNHFVWLKFIKS
ncbi:MAG: T9SS type A sorting domain-containing protein [Bacteroidetes bacterium]|nr:T9SS type A sorting domain-containing protein [Bacteroidota bacterium]